MRPVGVGNLSAEVGEVNAGGGWVRWLALGDVRSRWRSFHTTHGSRWVAVDLSVFPLIDRQLA
jgi:hypothetical protein